MSITTIQAFVTDGSNPINGYITYQLNSAIVDGSVLAIPKPTQVQLTQGQATFTLEATDFQQVSYHFQVFQVDSTGTATPYLDFFAIVPTTTAVVKFADLAQQTGVARDTQDTSYLTISRRLYNDTDFWNRLRTEVFIPKGAFDPTLYYRRGYVVTYNGSSYLCTAYNAIQNILPTDTTNWQLLASIGATGTGINGNTQAYDATAWNNQTDAPARGAVRDVIELLAKKTDITALAPLNNPNFTTSAALAGQPIATQPWVANGYAPLASPVFTGNPAAPTQPTTDNSNKLATTAFIASSLSSYAKLASPALTGTPTVPNVPLTSSSSGAVVNLATLLSAFTLTAPATNVGQIKTPVASFVYGSVPTTLDGQGFATINIGTGLTAGIGAIVVCNGDVSTSTISPAVVSTTLTSFTFKVPGVANIAYRCNFIIVGA